MATNIDTPTEIKAKTTVEPKSVEEQGANLYSTIGAEIPKEIDKMKSQEEDYAHKTQEAIGNIKEHSYTPETSTTNVPQLKTLKQSLGSFGGLITAVISILALKDGGASSLNFANMYNGMAQSIRKNNLQEFMAKSQEFKEGLEKLKTDNENKLQEYQQYMSSILTGNKLEEQKLRAELQPEQLNIQTLFSQEQLFNKTLERTVSLQRLAYSIHESQIRQDNENKRMALTKRGQNIYAGTAYSQTVKNNTATKSYLITMIDRLTKLDASGGKYQPLVNKYRRELMTLAGMKPSTQIKTQKGIPIKKKSKTWWGQ